LIGLWKLVAHKRPCRSKKESVLEVGYGLKDRSETRHQRLQVEAPVSDDANLLKLQAEAAAYLREAKCRDPSGPDEVIWRVLDAVARKYFRYAIAKQRT
jgi:hypothetical protein